MHGLMGFRGFVEAVSAGARYASRQKIITGDLTNDYKAALRRVIDRAINPAAFKLFHRAFHASEFGLLV